MKTPFFSAFGSLLFGRRAHRKSPPPSEDSGELQSIFGGRIPGGVLAPAASGPDSRKRIFSMEATFWVFLFQVLSPLGACREAVSKAQSWWHGSARQATDTDTSAYCQARARLPFAVLARLLRLIGDALAGRVLTRELWQGGRRVRVPDGTGLSMPDTAQNQRRRPRPSQQKPGCGFPVLKLCALLCLHSGALLRYAIGNKHNHGQPLTRTLIEALEKGGVLLAD